MRNDEIPGGERKLEEEKSGEGEKEITNQDEKREGHASHIHHHLLRISQRRGWMGVETCFL